MSSKLVELDIQPAKASVSTLTLMMLLLLGLSVSSSADFTDGLLMMGSGSGSSAGSALGPCYHSDVRLVGGASPSEGLLEVCRDGRWGTVCDDLWGIRETLVACRQQGYTSGEFVTPYASSSQDIFLDNVFCNGSESNLLECEHSDISDCFHTEDVHLNCSTPSVSECTEGGTRLAGGSREEDGYLELCLAGQWYPVDVCPNEWDARDSRVVCRQFGYPTGNPTSAFQVEHAALGSNGVILNDVHCNGSEPDLFSCESRVGTGQYCSKIRAGVTCHVCNQSEARLVGGASPSEGLLEVCRDGQWGTVCDDLWGIMETLVACRQQGYTSGEFVTPYASSSQDIFLDNVFCNGSESNLLECEHRDISDCTHTEDVHLYCSTPSVSECTEGGTRLAGGSREEDGYLELCLVGQWYPVDVCPNEWDASDARVVCRELGFFTGDSNVEFVVTLVTHHGSNAVILNDVHCNGSEPDLFSCERQVGTTQYCSRIRAGVTCIQDCENNDVRIVGSSAREGRVQFCYGELWGSICVYNTTWNDANADVVCRSLELGTGFALNTFAGRSAPVVLSDVVCSGSESSLAECSRASIGPLEGEDCQDLDVGVICQGFEVATAATPESPVVTSANTTTATPAASKAVFIGVGVAGGVLLLVSVGFIALLVLFCRTRRVKRKSSRGFSFASQHSRQGSNIYLDSSSMEATGAHYNLSRRHTQNFPLDLFISTDTIRLLDSIGQGEFGIVYKAHLVRPQHYLEEKMSQSAKSGSVPNKVVAVKTLQGHFNENDISETLRESAKMKDFDHPHVLSMLGVCIDAGPAPYIVMPFMANGSLQSYLRKERANLVLPADTDPDTVGEVQKKLADMCMQIAKGMEYLASKSFIHRDLATRNCMIDSAGIIKVADFGLSENTYSKTYFRQGKDSSVKLPIKWMAPESINDGVFSEKSDVWSFGVTCWEVFTGAKTPYPGQHPQAVITLVDNGERMAKPANAACSDQIYSIMLSCWEADPNDRPAFTQLGQSISGVLEGLADYFDFNTLCLTNPGALELKHESDAPTLDSCVHAEHIVQSSADAAASGEAVSSTASADEQLQDETHRPKEDIF